MRKSFKKVLAAVLVASMAFSTPIVSNAGSGEEGACVVKDVTETTTLSDSFTGAWWGGFSDYYRLTDDVDVTFDFTSAATSETPAGWNAPNVVITTDVDRNGTGYKEYAVVRSDNYGWGDNYDKTTNVMGGDDRGGTDWTVWKEVIKNCSGTIQVKKSASKVYVNMVITGNDSQGASKTFTQGYTIKGVDNPARIFIVTDTCSITLSKATVAEDVYSVTADAALNLVANDDAKKEATLTTVAKHNNVVDADAEVTFASADEAVATVDATGKVTAVANGTTTITSTYQGETAETTVKVTTDPKSVVISGEGVADNALQLVVNKEKAPLTGVAPVPVALTATVDPDTASNKKVVWTSDKKKVTVSETGVAQAAEDAADGTTAKITATVEGTSVKAELNVTVKVNEVAKLVTPGRIVIATPAAVTVSAGDKVQMSATVYGSGEDSNIVAANQNVVWSAEVKRVVSGTAVTVSGTAVDVSATGEVTVPSNVEDNDVVAVTATSKVASDVKGIYELRVRNGEVLTGTAWWTGMQVSKDRIIDADNPSVNFIVQPTDVDGFCVEIYSLDKKEDGTYAKHEKADAVSTEKGAYITFSYPGSFDGWMAGSNACKVNADGSNVSIGSDALYSISTDKVNGFNVADTYQVTVTKSGNDVIMLIKDLTTNAWFWRAIAKDVDMDSDILGVHFMAQFGTFTLYNVNEDGSAIETLTTDKTDKPVTVTPGKRPTVAPTATPDNSTKATATPTPNNNNTATNTNTTAKTTLKKATITVKNGKKKVSKVTVKKGKKVTLKVSANSKGKISMAKLSKKAKKVASVTLKSGKLTIKGKKKGKVTIKLTAKKTSKYKAATKSVK